MGFKFNKRINLGKGLGLNISKSGISPSYRTKRGSISRKGYSIKTGVPGLSYGKQFGKDKGCAIVLFLICILSVTIYSCSSAETVNEEQIVSSPCVDTNCADYTSQSAAQSAFNADPDCRGDLDADNDGIACEEPGNSVTVCPTTANCGCSNKTKAECEASPCCKWVTGEGCKCN